MNMDKVRELRESIEYYKAQFEQFTANAEALRRRNQPGDFQKAAGWDEAARRMQETIKETQADLRKELGK